MGGWCWWLPWLESRRGRSPTRRSLQCSRPRCYQRRRWCPQQRTTRRPRFLRWNQDEEDLQLGALFSALAPVAINAVVGALNKGEQDLGFSAGGSFTTPWGGAGGSLGWNQDEENLQLGALFSALAPVAINAVAGAI